MYQDSASTIYPHYMIVIRVLSRSVYRSEGGSIFHFGSLALLISLGLKVSRRTLLALEVADVEHTALPILWDQVIVVRPPHKAHKLRILNVLDAIVGVKQELIRIYVLQRIALKQDGGLRCFLNSPIQSIGGPRSVARFRLPHREARPHPVSNSIFERRV